MTDLKQQLEAMRDRMADEELPAQWFFNGEDRYSDADRDNYKAGFNAAIPIILKAVEQRDNLCESGRFSVVDTSPLNQELLNLFVDGGK